MGILASYIAQILLVFWFSNMNIQILYVESRVWKTDDFVICFDNLFDVHFDEVVERINVLFDQTFSFEKSRDQLPFVLGINILMNVTQVILQRCQWKRAIAIKSASEKNLPQEPWWVLWASLVLCRDLSYWLPPFQKAKDKSGTRIFNLCTSNL